MQPYAELVAWMLAVLLILLTVGLVLLTHFWTRDLRRTVADQRTMLSSRESMIQSLLNQLRASDPVTLAHLQTTTLPQPSEFNSYVPTAMDELEAERHAELLKQSGYKVNQDEGLENDYADAFGLD